MAAVTLERVDYNVSVASSGGEALQRDEGEISVFELFVADVGVTLLSRPTVLSRNRRTENGEQRHRSVEVVLKPRQQKQ